MAATNEDKSESLEKAEKKFRKEIYTYRAPFLLYAMGWSEREDKPFRLALGSFLEAYSNRVVVVQMDEETDGFVEVGKFEHPYPPTKIMWIPDRAGTCTDLLATTGDYLRVWKVRDDNSIHEKILFNNNKQSEFCAPLTSFDWNTEDPNIMGTSSIDTTCTIWDVETCRARTQLIAHDKEVYDIAFASKGTSVFGSVGADGSVRMFDLRSLEHSTIIYESSAPLLRLDWNKIDANYIAVMPMDSPKTIIIDVRMPALPLATLNAHNASANGISWAPHSCAHIVSAGDDSQALIWDLKEMPKPIDDPILAYRAASEINNLKWSRTQPDWIGIAYHKYLQILRV